MATGQASKKAATQASAAAGGDPFEHLPEQLIHHVLSFLPAQEAVRTCVLARRWRCLWEGATGLRITAADAPEQPLDPPLSRELRDFVDHLFLLRGHAPLDTCEFVFDLGEDVANLRPHVNIWIRYAIRCIVRRLRLSIRGTLWDDFRFLADNLPLVSRHLNRLELTDIELNASFLDFSGCPGLEDLAFYNCSFASANRISSRSLKHLTVVDSYLHEHPRPCIDAPSIVSLRLDYPYTTPTLGSMPCLVEAFVRLGDASTDYPDSDADIDCCQGCDSYGSGSTGKDANNTTSVLLQGLSEAQSLVLVDEFPTCIFKKDMKWCPTFRKLKTLTLNKYWCVPPEYRALTCILKHSPVLEKLTLYLHKMGPKNKVEIKGRSAALSENLRMVAVRCKVVDKRVTDVLDFLRNTLNIDFNYRKVKEVLAEDGPATP